MFLLLLNYVVLYTGVFVWWDVQISQCASAGYNEFNMSVPAHD